MYTQTGTCSTYTPSMSFIQAFSELVSRKSRTYNMGTWVEPTEMRLPKREYQIHTRKFVVLKTLKTTEIRPHL